VSVEGSPGKGSYGSFEKIAESSGTEAGSFESFGSFETLLELFGTGVESFEMFESFETVVESSGVEVQKSGAGLGSCYSEVG